MASSFAFEIDEERNIGGRELLSGFRRRRSKMTKPNYWLTASRRSAAIGIVALTASLLGIASGAMGQDQSAATPADAIVARKTMMDSLSEKMDVIEMMIASGKALDLEAGHANADAISVFLMAFPHLFPPATNQWKPNVDRDPVTDTFASPDVWTKFADFYRQAAAASKSAYNASRAQTDAEFKAAIAQLRTGCNACHAAYLKTD
jgi:cytochrome c556